MRIIILLILIVPLVILPVAVAMAQEPTPTEEPLPEFPDAPPELPSELPTNPLELISLFEGFVLFGAGLVAKYLTDIVKLVPGIGSNEKTRKGIIRLVAVAASLVVTVGMIYLTDLATFLEGSGLWAAFLAILSLQFGAHRSEKLLRALGARLIGA